MLISITKVKHGCYIVRLLLDSSLEIVDTLFVLSLHEISVTNIEEDFRGEESQHDSSVIIISCIPVSSEIEEGITQIVETDTVTVINSYCSCVIFTGSIIIFKIIVTVSEMKKCLKAVGFEFDRLLIEYAGAGKVRVIVGNITKQLIESSITRFCYQ